MATLMRFQHLKLFLLEILIIFTCHFVSAQLPSVYDLRSLNLVTPVKDQGSCGSCWAFATIASIESNWLKQGAGIHILSEDNIIDCHLFDEAPCSGGSFYMANALLSRHGGPLYLADDPYSPSISDCALNQTFPPLPPYYCEEFRLLPATISTIKETLYNQGAVASTMFFTMSNYNSSTYKYYDNFISSSDSANAHGVTIAGWNDTMTFPGAPGVGGWIIKDSFGTSWAQNGYFYVSFYDAGILSENAIFPIKQDIPPTVNNCHVYAYDAYGWVDNKGFGSNIAYGLTSYTLIPAWGQPFPQQIKRLGTYAVENNSILSFEIYKSFSNGVLADLIFTSTITCDFKGFYTVPVTVPTQYLGTMLFIKTRYQCPAGTTNPIPVEIYEAGHTSSIVLSSNSGWISTDGNSWIPTGSGTANPFDLCIKMYTEDAPVAVIECPVDTVCENTPVHLLDISPLPKDSIRWLIDDEFYSSMPAIDPVLPDSGIHQIKLAVFLGNNSDTSSVTILIYALPPIPVITQAINTLYSSEAFAYQWFENGFLIPGANEQSFSPTHNGIYLVETENENGCKSMSAPYNFILIGNRISVQNSVEFYPNPCTKFIIINLAKGTVQSVEIVDLTSKVVLSISSPESPVITMPENMPKGTYILRITTKESILNNKLIKL